MGFPTRMRVSPQQRGPFSGPGPSNNRGRGVLWVVFFFSPPPGHRSPGCGDVEWKCFPTWRLCFLTRGCVFPCAG